MIFKVNFTMGNLASSGAFLAVKIENDGQALVGGSVLKGVIYLNVNKDTVTADALTVSFFGQESTHIVYHRDKETKHAYQKKEIINVSSTLYNFSNGSVHRGQYEYPFQFVLPNGLPGKQGKKSSSDYFVIEYFVEAHLHRHGIMTWDVKNYHEIPLSDPPYIGPKSPSLLQPVVAPVSFFCCLSSGSISIMANVSSQNVVVGEKLVIEYGIHNESTSRIKAIEIKVIQKLQFHAHGHHSYQSYPIFQRRIESSELTGVNPLRSASSHIDIEAENQYMLDTKKYIEYEISDLRPSYEGDLGFVKYEVRLQAKTPFCVDDPDICIPIHIYRRGLNMTDITLEQETPYDKPSDWNPTVSSRILLDINTSQVSKSADSTSVSSLLDLLANSNRWNETSILQEWVVHGNATLITPEDVGRIFQAIKGEYGYTSFPQILGSAMKVVLTTKHVVSAANVSPVGSRPAILIEFSSYCTDKSNAKADFSTLDLPPYMLSSLGGYYGI